MKTLTAVVVQKEAREEQGASEEKRLKNNKSKGRHPGFLQKHGTPEMIALAVTEMGKRYEGPE